MKSFFIAIAFGTCLVASQEAVICEDRTTACAKWIENNNNQCAGRMLHWCEKSCNFCGEEKAPQYPATSLKPQPTTPEPTTTTPKPTTTTPKPTTTTPKPTTTTPKPTTTTPKPTTTTPKPTTTTPKPTTTTPKPTTTTNVPTTGARLVEQCEDVSSKCALYVRWRGNRCNTNIKRYCKKSCGLCGDEASDTAKPEPTSTKATTTLKQTATEKPAEKTTALSHLATNCRDSNPHCKAYFAMLKNSCTSKMKKSCRNTCGTCGADRADDRSKKSGSGSAEKKMKKKTKKSKKSKESKKGSGSSDRS